MDLFMAHAFLFGSQLMFVNTIEKKNTVLLKINLNSSEINKLFNALKNAGLMGIS